VTCVAGKLGIREAPTHHLAAASREIEGACLQLLRYSGMKAGEPNEAEQRGRSMGGEAGGEDLYWNRQKLGPSGHENGPLVECAKWKGGGGGEHLPRGGTVEERNLGALRLGAQECSIVGRGGVESSHGGGSRRAGR